MNIKNFVKISLGLAMSVFAMTSCVHNDDWETPPINCNNRFDAPTKTLAEVVALAPASGSYTFPDEKQAAVIVDGYVVSSDENGNFYKTISFQDKPENPTVGLQIEVDRASNYADYPVGSHIRIKLNGLLIAKDRGVVKIGSKDPTYAIGRIPGALLSRYVAGVCAGNGMEVAALKPLSLPNLAEAKKDKYINMLVTVPNVQFAASDLGKSFTEFVNGAGVDTDRTMEDVYGNSATLRTSGFASFAATKLPEKSGDITFVVSKYNTNYQMIIRSLNDINFTKDRLVKPTDILIDGFTNLNNWTAVNVNGTETWGTTTFGNPAPSAIMDGKRHANEDWLILKPQSLAGYSEAFFSFETDARYEGSTFEVFVTDNYTGDPKTTTWTKVNPILDTDLNAFGGWVGSGAVSLKQFLGKDKVCVAFKYTSVEGASTTWEVDNFALKGLK